MKNKFLFKSIFTQMNKDKQAEQIEKLNKLKEKDLPENIKKSIDEKQKHLIKPFSK